MITTDEHLLDQLRETPAHVAWELFFRQYWKAILSYGVKLGLRREQAEDVLQESMIALMRILPEFEYDRGKRFRNFLFTIVHRKALGVLRRQRRETRLIGSISGDPGAMPEEPPDHQVPPDVCLEEKAERLWRESLFEQVLEEIGGEEDFKEANLSIIRAMVVEGKSAAEIAAERGVTANSIYQAKSRLVRRVRARMERLVNESRL